MDNPNAPDREAYESGPPLVKTGTPPKHPPKPASPFQRRLGKATLWVFALSILLAVLLSSRNTLYSLLFFGIMLAMYGVAATFSGALDVGMLTFTVAGLAIVIPTGACLWAPEPIGARLKYDATLGAILCVILVQSAAIAITVLRHLRQNRRCSVEVQAQCVRVDYRAANGAPGRFAAFCPTLELQWDGASYILYDALYRRNLSVVVQPGDEVTIRINPDEPNDFYRPRIRDTATHIRHNLYVISIAAVLFLFIA